MSGNLDFSDASMLELFRMEVDAHSTVLNEGLVALASGAASADVLAALMRAAHSLKGAARIIGLQPAVDVAHAMEDCFVKAQEGKLALKQDHVELLLQATDFLSHSALAETDPVQCKNRAAEIVAAFHAHSPGGPARAVVATEPLAPPAASPAVTPRAAQASEAMPAAAATAGLSRAVRVNAVSLNRLMGLAGETLIEAGWLSRFEESLRRLQAQQGDLSASVKRLREHAGAHATQMPATAACIQDVQQRSDAFQAMLSERMQAFEAYALRSDNLSHRLYREVIASRMRPFADGVQGFPRMVHDLARALKKQVRFDITGRNTEIDREILERLEAPLNHLLRNALDHGIEPPQERMAAGKPEQGRITLDAMHKGGMLFITVTDDGRGVELERVRRKIVERRLTTAELAAKLTEAEVLEFLFLPGFSTAQQVTEISGRGVGLDVVRTMVQEVSGQLRVSSQPGKGCTFHVQLPITLSVLGTLLVEICGDPYAFPLARIARVLKLSHDAIETMENCEFFKLDGQRIGLLRAQQVLELEQTPASGEEMAVIVIGDRHEQYGLVVDRVLGERKVVVRPLDMRLGKVPNINAAALMEDGQPLLIVDVEDLLHSIRALLKGGRLQQVVSRSAQQKVRKRILIVDDSLTVRAVQRKLLENKGYEVELATDGAEGWAALRASRFDLVITDVDMPRMNGFELVSAMRADANCKGLPVVIVSYKDREEDRHRGMEAGANYYLTKSSFHDDSLLNAVLDLIGEAQ